MSSKTISPRSECKAKNGWQTCPRHNPSSQGNGLRNKAKNLLRKGKIDEAVNIMLPKKSATVSFPVTVTNKGFEVLAKTHLHALKPEEKLAVYQYSDRNGSIAVNRTLNQHGLTEHTNPEIVTMVHNLDRSIFKSSLPNAETVYRGVERLPESWSEATPGQTVHVPSFSSTSLNPDKALEFTSKETPVIIQTVTKNGLAILTHENEHEILLPRNQSYKIVSNTVQKEIQFTTPHHDANVLNGRNVTRKNVRVIVLESIN